MVDLSKKTDAELQAVIQAAKRLEAVHKARENLLPFIKLTMPDPEAPDDVDRSQFHDAPHHRLLCEALERVERGECLRLAISMPPQHGKLVADSVPVLTPAGWTTHGALRVGDYVFGPDGAPTRVVGVSEPDFATLEVVFTDGAVIKVHPRHEWTVVDRARGADSSPVTLETQQIAARAYWSGRDKKRAVFSVDPVPVVQFPARDLPVDPYVLGAWLGDGSTTKPCITHAPSDSAVIDEIVRRGYEVSTVCTHAGTGVLTTYFSGKMSIDLKALGVLGRKHLPDEYATASVEQRLDLLAGLIDTDGYVYKRTGRVCISSADAGLVESIAGVIRSLGWRATIASFAPCTSSSGIVGKKTVFQLTFSPDREIPVKLERKRMAARPAVRRRRGIKDIRSAEPERGVCIQVDRPDGLYLVGRELIPTHNSETASRRFPAWFMGRNPHKNLMFATYNDTFAAEFGAEIRDIMASTAFRHVFPKVRFRKGSQAKDYLVLEQRGQMAFIGRGGSGTGKPADLFIIDDPLKNDEEAQSPTTRKQLHEWFSKVAYTRCHVASAIIIIHTRWSEDDLIGRLCDPDHPDHDKEIADAWTYINIPAILRDDAVTRALGREPGEALWPERFPLPHLMSAKKLNPRGFEALYQGRPAPEDGDYFRRVDIVEYDRADLPQNLRMYGASDHAVTEKQQNDATVLGCVGVDENDDIWIMPDVVWERMETDRTVEEMLVQMKAHRPLLWWMESELISKSFGPFLYKSMHEQRVYCTVDPVTPSRDKRTRARAIQGRMRQGRVHFPRFAPWWGEAKAQLLKFPYATHDDFVDWLAHIGMGLTKEVAADAPRREEKVVRVGSIDWIKAASARRARRELAEKQAAGW